MLGGDWWRAQLGLCNYVPNVDVSRHYFVSDTKTTATTIICPYTSMTTDFFARFH
jgi:hypothetical protein